MVWSRNYFVFHFPSVFFFSSGNDTIPHHPLFVHRSLFLTRRASLVAIVTELDGTPLFACSNFFAKP